MGDDKPYSRTAPPAWMATSTDHADEFKIDFKREMHAKKRDTTSFFGRLEKSGAAKKARVEEPSVPAPIVQELEVLLSGISFDATEDDIKSLFAECECIKKINLLMYKEGKLAGKSKGRGYIKFGSEADVQKALAKSGTEWLEREITIERVAPKLTKEQLSVYIAGFPYGASEEEVEDHFADAGEVTKVSILKDQDGKSKGQGFVLFSAPEAVEQALLKDGKQMMGRQLLVKRAIAKAEKAKANPKGKAAQRTDSRSFVVENVSLEEVASRIRQILQETGGIEWEERLEGGTLEGTGKVSPADGEGYTFEISAGANAPEIEGDETPPEASDLEDFCVTMGFSEGETTLRKQFWLLYESVERDVMRTSRKWRRLAAKSGGGGGTAPKAVPAPNRKMNMYDQNAASISNAVAEGLKVPQKKKKKKKIKTVGGATEEKPKPEGPVDMFG